MPVILATQEAEIKASPGKQFLRSHLKKTLHKKKGLVE
jgi:hypothetical protein